METLSVERLREALDYDPETGVFTRKRTSNINPRAQEGMKAGARCSNGYLCVRVDTTRYLSHRLAWFYVYGHWPKELDHVNGVKDDNRIANLRKATRSQNMANGPRQRNNTSGAKGVCFDRTNAKWMAYVYMNGKMRNLGRFDSLEAAKAARLSAHRKAHGDFARS